MTSYAAVVDAAVRVTESVGSLGMVGGGAAVLLGHAPAALSGRLGDAGYRRLRRDLGRVILVGLEILIVADIVQTVLVDSSPTRVGVLGAVVLIRTVLSFSLDVEIDGVLPWRSGQEGSGRPSDVRTLPGSTSSEGPP